MPCSSNQKSQLTTDDDYTKLAVGLGVPLAALAALSAVACFCMSHKTNCCVTTACSMSVFSCNK